MSLKEMKDKVVWIYNEITGVQFENEEDLTQRNSDFDLEYPTSESEKYEIETVDSYGWEGQGEEYWFINKITNTETKEVIYVKFSATYNSWDNNQWDSEFDIVEPKEVMVTQYVPITLK